MHEMYSFDKKETILLTNIWLRNYAGSEINCLSLAKALMSKGYNVEVASLETGDPMLSEFMRENILIKNVLEEELARKHYDIIWAHHGIVLDYLIFSKGITADKIVLSSLSPFEPYEGLPSYANETSICLANSWETRKKLVEEGINPDKIVVFPNYVSKEWLSFDQVRTYDLTPKRAAIVSNHVPQELLEAQELLTQRGCAVDIYGVDHNAVLITPEVLNQYDLVITIGKTVQYAMALLIPVYCYDMHGGPGYITADELDRAAFYNFSGRGFPKKSAQVIAEEVIGHYYNNLEMLPELLDFVRETSVLENNIEDVCGAIEGAGKVDVANISHKYGHIKRKNMALVRLFGERIEYQKLVRNLNAEIQNLNIEIQKRDAEIQRQNAEIQKRDAEIQRQNAEIQKQDAEIQNLNASLQESSNINVMLQTQLRNTNDIIFMSKNIQRTANDLLYVMQHSQWYQKAQQQAEHPTLFYRLACALRTNGFWGTGKKAIKKIIKKTYIFSRQHNCMKRPLKLINRAFRKLFPKWGASVNSTLFEAKLQMNHSAAVSGLSHLGDALFWQGEKPIPFSEKPLVSVIVPNYNHSAYLRERLESVYNQTYPNFEVILLDDCSTDNSREILLEYANRYPEKTIVDFNDINGGKVFKQWNKGINHAKGKLIWIAESDDWCELDFLEKMVPNFEYQSVMLAFCNSIFMQDGIKCWSLAEYLSDIPELRFDHPFMISAHIAVNTAFAIKNMVPNVSSAMFRNTGEIPKKITDIWQNFRLCGDWLFYLYTIKGGTISYTNETINYYRIHKNSTSLNIQKKPEYYQEQEKISTFVVQNYDINLKVFDKVLHNLEQHYREINDVDDVTVVHENYSIDRITAVAGDRRPSVLMCGFSLQIGGGETYPIVLANEMKEQGIAVTFLNFNLDSYSEQIRNMLDPKVPVITLESTDYIGSILTQTGADIVHSHHASVDTMLSIFLRSMDTKCRQIVTLHGMYETMDTTNCKKSFDSLAQTCKKFIYIADKNLTQIDTLGYKDRFDLVKIGNGLPRVDVTPVDRTSLGIDEKDFVFCIVSRALPQKGWQEATDAVIEANKTSKRNIHLILVGDGEMRKKLSTLKSPYVHLVGQRSNVRDYFATSDMGLLPSTYKGESFPLVIIECMLTGNPVLASNLGEIRHQLTAKDGELAGMLIELNDWKLDVDELSSMMVQVANDETLYQQLRSRVPSASEKFDITNIVRQHLDIYSTVSNQSSRRD